MPNQTVQSSDTLSGTRFLIVYKVVNRKIIKYITEKIRQMFDGKFFFISVAKMILSVTSLSSVEKFQI
jgi:hypothetical protein